MCYYVLHSIEMCNMQLTHLRVSHFSVHPGSCIIVCTMYMYSSLLGYSVLTVGMRYWNQWPRCSCTCIARNCFFPFARHEISILPLLWCYNCLLRVFINPSLSYPTPLISSHPTFPWFWCSFLRFLLVSSPPFLFIVLYCPDHILPCFVLAVLMHKLSL